MSKPKIGFIGLGLMGAALVNRLQDLGYSVSICSNISRSNIDATVARDAHEVDTARQVAQASDIIILCMDTSANVETRMRGLDGVIASLTAGNVVIDFGTSLPTSTRLLGDEVAGVGTQYLDAPLGRTPSRALEDNLNIMASGNLGENVFHLGELGSGHTIKLINNFFGMTVANAMADVAGVDRSQMHSVMAAGPLQSGMMGFVKAYAVDADPSQLPFAIKNAVKDVGYYSQIAQEVGVESIMS
jgi:3-hydroxyisobutyrate dehydrogenase-like beta-hydroxyacid dehydrogenase